MDENLGQSLADEMVPRVLLDRMIDAFLALDDEGRVTYLNERAKTVLGPLFEDGSDAERLRGELLWDALPQARETKLYERFDEAIDRQEGDTYEDYYPPLETWFEVTLYPSEEGLSVYFRDVTERKGRVDRLRRREAALRNLYEAIASPDRSFEDRVDALIETGRSTLGTEYGTLSRIENGNYRFEFVRGPGDTVEPGTMVDLEETYCEHVAALKETVVIGNVEMEASELTDRAEFTELGITSYVGTPVHVDGEVYGTLCFYGTAARTEGFSDWETTLVDLMGRWVGTAVERNRAAARLERQNERLEQFAGVLSHDLRNPLQVVRGNLELARRDHDSEHLENAEAAVERIDRMVTEMLSLARTGETIEETETAELATLAREAWEPVSTTEGALSVEVTGTVEADRARVLRLLENLFRNSVEHSDGPVAIRVEDTADGFAVVDDGPGIPADVRDRVLEYGYTDSADGTGFGLSIVAEIAAAHDWSLDITDAEGDGTRVVLGEAR